MSMVTVKIVKVIRVGNDFVRVRDVHGNVITVTAPHDNTLKMSDYRLGEGVITCPREMAGY